MTRVAMSRTGRYVVTRRSGSLEIVDALGTQPRIRIASDARELACVGATLWALRDRRIERYALASGRALEAIELPAAGNGLAVDGGEAGYAAIVTGTPSMFAIGQHAHVDASMLPHAAIAALGGRSYASVDAGRVSLHELGRRDPIGELLRTSDEVLAVHALFGRKIISVVTRSQAEDTWWIVRPDGTRLHRIVTGRATRWTVAGDAGLALVIIGDRWSCLDLRYGHVRCGGVLPFPVFDVALSADGQHLVMAQDDRESPAIVHMPAAELLAAEPTPAIEVVELPAELEVVEPPVADDVIDSIREFIGRIAQRRTVFEDWGFDAKVASSRGLTALFYGPPGTGKSMVAGLIARELGLELYRVDLARIVSKWIGETEKHLAEVFDAAEDGQVVILFDEADSLFAKRTEVRTSVDRYANLEVNYLLQRLDTFEGIAILTTNLDGSIDPAFKRRMSLRLQFPFPDEDMRKRLWAAHIPNQAPVAGDFNFGELARRFPLSGGYIRNSALRAAFLAAQERRPMGQEHLLRAIALEYRELGKLATDGRME